MATGLQAPTGEANHEIRRKAHCAASDTENTCVRCRGATWPCEIRLHLDELAPTAAAHTPERSGMPVTDSRDRITLSNSDVEHLAARYRVPVEDVLLIAVNLYGIASVHDRHRARVAVRLLREPDVAWTVIVPLNAANSPFTLVEDYLFLGDRRVALVEDVTADESVGGYFRHGGRAATLNPNARSRCVGCAFCPNTLEAAADPRLSQQRELDGLLAAMVEQHPRHDLTELAEVTVSTGCFEREDAAVTHLVALRRVLSERGINARIGFLTSVIQSANAFDRLGSQVAPFVLRLTAECFGRRDLLLKASKATLTTSAMPAVLRRCRRAGMDASYTYIVGLDSLEAMTDGVRKLAPHVSEFPNFQVYQAHNAIMGGFRARGADTLEFYLRARQQLEQIMAPTGLRPAAWECYRPLWHFTFAGDALVTR